MGEKRNACRLLMGKPKGKKQLGRRRRRWVDNIKMDFGEIGWCGVDWIGLVQSKDKDKDKSSCEFGIELSGFIKCWETIEWLTKLVASRVVISYVKLLS
jgi:hypothetical protein